MTTSWPQQIGAAIRAGRQLLGMRFAPLADKTRDLGRPVHRVALGKLENGERDISVMELVGIAASLGVSPLSLLFPDVTSDVEVLPGHVIPGTDALGWFLGIGETGPDGARPIRIPTRPSSILAIRLVEVERDLRIQQRNISRHERAIELAEAGSIEMDGPALRTMESENLNHARRQVELLQGERDRLRNLYQRQVISSIEDGEESDA